MKKTWIKRGINAANTKLPIAYYIRGVFIEHIHHQWKIELELELELELIRLNID